MIEKMQYVKIMGHIDDFDRVTEKYISKYDIQLEDAHNELSDTDGLYSFDTQNPYNHLVNRAERIMKQINVESDVEIEMEKERALEILEKTADYFQKKYSQVVEREEKKEKLTNYIKQLEPFKSLGFRLEDLASLEFIKYHFGRMPSGNFKQFETFLYSSSNMICVASVREEGYIYGMYFTTTSFKDEAKTLLASFNFEKIWISYDIEGRKLSGTPAEIYENCLIEYQKLEDEIREFYNEKMSGSGVDPSEFISAYHKIKDLAFYYDARRFAAKSENKFYFFTGWMFEKDVGTLEKEMETDTNIILTLEGGSSSKSGKPPTKITNPFFAKPFEFFVRMYALPSYGEMDPTIFIAITYTLFFGMMFGDVGQGAVFVIGGYLLYKLKGMAIGAIGMAIGFSSMFFGFMYGSIFGLEHVIPSYWMRPMESIRDLLVFSVVLGVFLIFITMFINISNAIRKKDKGEILFSHNGINGLVLYSSLLYMLYITVMGSEKSGVFAIPLILISVLIIIFKIPLSQKVNGEKVVLHGGIGMFFMESVIELFEVLLSYFTNTISFIRIGAFALGHVGIMTVVLMLAGEETGNLNPIVMIIGNIIVIGLEGLVVGIQALRLNFYEMFSRFFEGEGREFVPYNSYRK